MNPKVSIIIPIYNSEKYLQETLDSVLKQTYKNIEVILVDDGSDRKPIDIINKFNDNRIMYIYKENGGVSSARNLGIEAATGEYIAFIDSDDIWDEEKIKIQVQELISNEYDACYCGYKLLNIDGNLKNFKTKYKKGFILDDIIKLNAWAQTSTWLINKEFLLKNKIKFTEGCNYGEDIEFFIKIACRGKITSVNKYLSIYRIIPNDEYIISMKYLHVIKVWKRIDKYLIDNNMDYSNIIYNYYIPSILIYTINELINKNLYEEIEIIKKEYTNEFNKLNNFKIVNGLKSMYIKFLFKFKIKNNLNR